MLLFFLKQDIKRITKITIKFKKSQKAAKNDLHVHTKLQRYQPTTSYSKLLLHNNIVHQVMNTKMVNPQSKL